MCKEDRCSTSTIIFHGVEMQDASVVPYLRLTVGHSPGRSDLGYWRFDNVHGLAHSISCDPERILVAESVHGLHDEVPVPVWSVVVVVRRKHKGFLMRLFREHYHASLDCCACCINDWHCEVGNVDDEIEGKTGVAKDKDAIDTVNITDKTDGKAAALHNKIGDVNDNTDSKMGDIKRSSSAASS